MLPLPNKQHCLRTQKELSVLIKELQTREVIAYSGPHKSEEIDIIEKKYSIRLPSDYRQFLVNYGFIARQEFTILGLQDDNFDVLSLDTALEAFKLANIPVSKQLCPVEFLEDKSFACLVCDTEMKIQYAPVVIFKLQAPRPISELDVIAGCFRDYAYNRLVNLRQIENSIIQDNEPIDHSWDILEKHIAEYHEKFNYDHAKGGKLPRSTDWRPYRYCIQDVVFGITVVRHNQEGNCLQVDVFLTADVPEYGPLAGARALTTFLLSEAYKCGGTMELRFTKNVEGGHVPAEIRELAQQYGIHFGQKGKIEPSESKALYAAMTGFSQELQDHLQRLEKQGNLKMARACYVVHHGIWSKEQLELIALGSENPESVLGGQSKPIQRHLYYHDLLHARSALMTGMFERIMMQRERKNDEGVTFDMEDDLQKVTVGFDGKAYAKYYICSESIELTWLYGAKHVQTIPENIFFQVVVRARDLADLRLHTGEDLKIAAKLKTERKMPTFILFPRDFTDLPADWVSQIVNKSERLGIGILVCPESVSNLDVDAAQRLATSRVLRQ